MSDHEHTALVARLGSLLQNSVLGGPTYAAMAAEAIEALHAQRADLELEHQRFHMLADKALMLADSGHMHLASTLLNTDFERSRARLLDMLRTLQRG